MKTVTNYEKIYRLLFHSDKNLFITGPGGTGKSYLINKYVEQTENVIVCGTTGMAAANIGGDTMHRIFAIPVPACGADLKKIDQSKIKPLIKADVVIIDEISMCRNDTFSFAYKVLKKAEKLKGKPIRLIVVGDFSQLPPVVTKSDAKLLKKFQFDESGFAFTTKEWGTCNFVTCELSEVHRQNDVEFIKELHKVRLADKSCVPYFNAFLVNEVPDGVIRLCGTNAEVSRINQEYLDSLPGIPFPYQSKKEGKTNSGYIDDIILLKDNARIVFLANDVKGSYRNGDMGTIVKCYQDHIDVDLKGKVIHVYPHDFLHYEYKVKSNSLLRDEVGVIKQIPVRLAAAITIHKSQGKTFDKIVLSPKIFAAGQLYVALSRVTGPDGLYITEPVIEDYLISDKTVLKFYKNDYTWVYKTKKKASSKTTTTKKKGQKVTKKPAEKQSYTKEKVSSKKTTSKKIDKGKAEKKNVTKTKQAKKKTATKKTATKKQATKKSATKKPATKKPATKKPATNKTSTKKPATKKPDTKKQATKNTTTKKGIKK